MFRLSRYIAVILISSFFAISCQGIEEMGVEEEKDASYLEREDNPYTTLMSLGGNLPPQPQGGDCWGDFFFQFSTNNSTVRVYNLLTRKLVYTIKVPLEQIGFVPTCHCNTVCFGSEYYDDKDEFPLIYVSTGNASNGYTGALVYRITRKQYQFDLALVQTLRFPVDKSSWTEFVPAGEYAYLCYTSERIIYKYRMPKLSEGDIILTRELAEDSFQFAPQPEWMLTSRNQDRLFYNGKIIYITGVPEAGEASAFVILNMETLERETIIDFLSIGLNREPESVFKWRDKICVAFLDQIVILKI